MRFSVAVAALVSVVSVSAVDHVIKVGAGGVDLHSSSIEMRLTISLARL